MIKLSFIVPVYNVAPYLQKCVESLLAQDYDDYEIILVDDGSTDDSPQICDEFASPSFTNSLTHSVVIKVIHQDNGGLSAARNAGIKAAEGKYICFVDSDDYWEENVLGGLMAQAEREKLDVLRFDYQNVRLKREGEYEVFEPNKTPRYIDRKNEVIGGETYLNTRMGYACYAWAFFVRREIVPYFKEGIYYEDTEWTPRMLVNSKRVNCAQQIVYNYFWRNGSITKGYSKEHIQKKIQSLIQVNLSLRNLLRSVNDKRWVNGCIADNVFGILNNIAVYDYDSASYWIDIIKQHGMLPLHGYQIRKTTKMRYQIINLSPYLYCWLRHIRVKHLSK